MTDKDEIGGKVKADHQIVGNPEWLKKLLAETDVIDERLSHQHYRLGSLVAIILLSVMTVCLSIL